MLGEIIYWTAVYLFHSVVLLVLLWIMIRLQKLNYNWLGLIGSAFLAGGLDMIPYFGHVLAVPVLYICIWRVTRSSLFPDAAFTVVLAYALMFGVNLLVIGMLMGDLRPNLRPTTESADDMVTNYSFPVAPKNVAPTNPPSPPVVAVSPASKATNALARILAVKGLIRNGPKSVLMLRDGTKTLTLNLGQKTVVQTPEGPYRVRFDSADTNAVILSVEDETLMKLALP